MPWAGGIFTLLPVSHAEPGTTIRAEQQNSPHEDFASGLNNCLTRDGSTTMLANLPMNGNKITGLAAATNSGDAVRLDQLPDADDILSAWLLAVNALAPLANQVPYATGPTSAALTALTPFARTLLAAPDLAAIWTLLYLGSLAGKSKISVPGDINASGTPADWSVLFGDGVWRSIFGLGVQWLDLTASRAKDTVYQNANGRAIAVSVTSSGGFIDRQLQVSADNTTWRTISDFNFSGTSTVTGVVPSGHYYRFVSSGTMFRWMELRS